MPRRIVACGGEQLFYPALTRYVLALTGKPRPKILFVPTASGDDAAYLLSFYQAFAGVECEPSHLLLFNRTVDDIAGFVRAQDVVMVGGGNTANMLAIWRLHGVEDALRNAYRNGRSSPDGLPDASAGSRPASPIRSRSSSARCATGSSSSKEARARTTTRRSDAVRSTRARSRPGYRPGSRSMTPSPRDTKTSVSSRS
jgi:hypothetical protein